MEHLALFRAQGSRFGSVGISQLFYRKQAQEDVELEVARLLSTKKMPGKAKNTSPLTRNDLSAAHARLSTPPAKEYVFCAPTEYPWSLVMGSYLQNCEPPPTRR